ncbi:hypothetical protein [Corynebacterium sp. 13CS0277]|uniref:hypothetical protein n=1 Tax=Corynebacterium sp. 13CS0277 TaxID=2071994 RepID=UPI001304E0B6|nr:hypothetical protein [Corynebacterium sp. 13CS0277]
MTQPYEPTAATVTTDFQLAPGETNVYGERFMISPAVPYMKAKMMASSTRFVYQVPHAFLGLLPLGGDEMTIPIQSISAVSTSSRLRVGRAIAGALSLLISLSMLTDGHFFAGVILFALGGLWLATCFPVSLVVTNHGGMSTVLVVSYFDREKLERFKQELQARVYTDQAAIHHGEAQDLRQQQLAVQNMQLAQMQMQHINHMQQGMPPQQPMAQGYGQQPLAQPMQTPPAAAQPVVPQAAPTPVETTTPEASDTGAEVDAQTAGIGDAPVTDGEDAGTKQ